MLHLPSKHIVTYGAFYSPRTSVQDFNYFGLQVNEHPGYIIELYFRLLHIRQHAHNQVIFEHVPCMY